MSIELDNAVASIKHLNIRKEGPDQEKVLAVDMKLEIIVAAEDVLPYFDSALRHFLFNDETNAVRFPAMGAIPWSGEMENMELDLHGLEFRNVRLSKFQIEPMLQQERQFVTLTLSASFQPEGRDVAVLAEYVQETAEIVIRPTQQQLFDERNAA